MKTRIYCYEKNWENNVPLVLNLFQGDEIIRREKEPEPQELLDLIFNMSTGLRSFLVDGCLHPEIKGHFLICSEVLQEYVSDLELQIDLMKSGTPAEWAEHIAARFYQSHPDGKDVGILICGITDEETLEGIGV